MEMNEITQVYMKYSGPKKLEPQGVPALGGPFSGIISCRIMSS